jgi:hypothetical protein
MGQAAAVFLDHPVLRSNALGRQPAIDFDQIHKFDKADGGSVDGISALGRAIEKALDLQRGTKL